MFDFEASAGSESEVTSRECEGILDIVVAFDFIVRERYAEIRSAVYERRDVVFEAVHSCPFESEMEGNVECVDAQL